MASLYTQIDQNKRETIIIMIAFILVISAIGWVAGELFAQGSGLFFIGIALIVSGISTFISYYNSDKIVLSISGAREVSFEQAPDLHNLVENMSIASGLPKPRVYIIDDPSMNAFATGRDPQHGVVCFTTGLLQKLEKRELEGVVAHEMAHIGNYDIRLMSVVSVLVGTIALIADWMTRSLFWGGGRRDNGGGKGGALILILGLILLILSPIIAQLIKFAVSRNREYLADATAAMITRYPKGLSDALRKISGDPNILKKASGATAHMFIYNPLKDKKMSNLFNTHPPVEERIARLESI